MDPYAFLCAENESFSMGDVAGDEGDVTIVTWSAKQAARRYGEELERAHRRLEGSRAARAARRAPLANRKR